MKTKSGILSLKNVLQFSAVNIIKRNFRYIGRIVIPAITVPVLFVNNITGRNCCHKKKKIETLGGKIEERKELKQKSFPPASGNNNIHEKSHRISPDENRNANQTDNPDPYIIRLNEILKLNKKVYEITQLIGKIAFNTNTLALKAAIETTRDSNKGSDFAAIAEELRIIAQNTSLALKEINHVFNITIGKISGETGSLKHPGNNINELQTKIINLATIFSDIYKIFKDIDEKSLQKSLNNNSQTDSVTAGRIKSVHESIPTRIKNIDDLNPHLNFKKPTVH